MGVGGRWGFLISPPPNKKLISVLMHPSGPPLTRTFSHRTLQNTLSSAPPNPPAQKGRALPTGGAIMSALV